MSSPIVTPTPPAASAQPSNPFEVLGVQATPVSAPLPTAPSFTTAPSNGANGYARAATVPFAPQALPTAGEPIKDLSDEELWEEVFGTGLPLLELIVLQARGWQFGNPLGVLGKAMATAVCAEPETVVYSGQGTVPLNLQLGYVGKSGQGKGLCMSAPMRPAGSNTVIVKETPASGETFVDLFFVREKNADNIIEAVRHKYPVIATWDEIDSYAAKTAGKGNTLEPHLRSAFTGGDVGDKSLSREREKVGMFLEAGTYRFVSAFGIQPKRAAPLLKDGGGGTLQRTLWLPITDYDAPKTAADIRAVRAELAQRLGLPIVPQDAPELVVSGPVSVTVDMAIQDEVLEHRALVVVDDASVADEDRHRNNYRIRVASIFAGWCAGMGNPAHVDAAAWRWADAVMELSARERKSTETSASNAEMVEAAGKGKLDAVRRMAAELESETAEVAQMYATVRRLRVVLTRVNERTERELANNYCTKKQRAVLHLALAQGSDSGLLYKTCDDKWAVTDAGRLEDDKKES